MLLRLLILISLSKVFCVQENGNAVKRLVSFPVPFELPNRNDRSEQCWLRIEDEELTETLTIYCYLAHGFLRNYIHDYNSRKLTEDAVEVSLWREQPKNNDEYVLTQSSESEYKGIKDWRVTTVLDPVTHMRLYVSLKADCRLIMYNRDGMSNYLVNCEKILFFINSRVSGSVISRAHLNLIAFASIFLVFAL